MSFRLNVSMDDIGRVMQRVVGVEKAALGARGPATMAMAERTRQQIIDNLEAGKSGVTWDASRLPPYFRLYDKPSGSSGGFPASQRGDLVRTVKAYATGADNATLSVGEGLPRPYHIWLEYGFLTAFQRRMVRFPFVRPSVEQVTPEFRGIVVDIVRRAIGG